MVVISEPNAPGGANNPISISLARQLYGTDSGVNISGATVSFTPVFTGGGGAGGKNSNLTAKQQEELAAQKQAQSNAQSKPKFTISKDQSPFGSTPTPYRSIRYSDNPSARTFASPSESSVHTLGGGAPHGTVISDATGIPSGATPGGQESTTPTYRIAKPTEYGYGLTAPSPLASQAQPKAQAAGTRTVGISPAVSQASASASKGLGVPQAFSSFIKQNQNTDSVVMYVVGRESGGTGKPLLSPFAPGNASRELSTRQQELTRLFVPSREKGYIVTPVISEFRKLLEEKGTVYTLPEEYGSVKFGAGLLAAPFEFGASVAESAIKTATGTGKLAADIFLTGASSKRSTTQAREVSQDLSTFANTGAPFFVAGFVPGVFGTSALDIQNTILARRPVFRTPQEAAGAAAGTLVTAGTFKGLGQVVRPLDIQAGKLASKIDAASTYAAEFKANPELLPTGQGVSALKQAIIYESNIGTPTIQSVRVGNQNLASIAGLYAQKSGEFLPLVTKVKGKAAPIIGRLPTTQEFPAFSQLAKAGEKVRLENPAQTAVFGSYERAFAEGVPFTTEAAKYGLVKDISKAAQFENTLKASELPKETKHLGTDIGLVFDYLRKNKVQSKLEGSAAQKTQVSPTLGVFTPADAEIMLYTRDKAKVVSVAEGVLKEIKTKGKSPNAQSVYVTGQKSGNVKIVFDIPGATKAEHAIEFHYLGEPVEPTPAGLAEPVASLFPNLKLGLRTARAGEVVQGLEVMSGKEQTIRKLESSLQTRAKKGGTTAEITARPEYHRLKEVPDTLMLYENYARNLEARGTDATGLRLRMENYYRAFEKSAAKEPYGTFTQKKLSLAEALESRKLVRVGTGRFAGEGFENYLAETRRPSVPIYSKQTTPKTTQSTVKLMASPALSQATSNAPSLYSSPVISFASAASSGYALPSARAPGYSLPSARPSTPSPAPASPFSSSAYSFASPSPSAYSSYSSPSPGTPSPTPPSPPNYTRAPPSPQQTPPSPTQYPRAYPSPTRYPKTSFGFEKMILLPGDKIRGKPSSPKELAKRQKAYRVRVKRFGKFYTTESGLPYGRALAAGVKRTKETLGATFKLVPLGETTLTDIPYSLNRNEFREYRIKNGRKAFTPLEFIQNRGFRLGTRQEVTQIQVSKKLAQARRPRAKKGSAFSKFGRYFR